MCAHLSNYCVIYQQPSSFLHLCLTMSVLCWLSFEWHCCESCAATICVYLGDAVHVSFVLMFFGQAKVHPYCTKRLQFTLAKVYTIARTQSSTKAMHFSCGTLVFMKVCTLLCTVVAQKSEGMLCTTKACSCRQFWCLLHIALCRLHRQWRGIYKLFCVYVVYSCQGRSRWCTDVTLSVNL